MKLVQSAVENMLPFYLSFFSFGTKPRYQSAGTLLLLRPCFINHLFLGPPFLISLYSNNYMPIPYHMSSRLFQHWHLLFRLVRRLIESFIKINIYFFFPLHQGNLVFFGAAKLSRTRDSSTSIEFGIGEFQ